uniref:Uncharacterized protein n=1 Tax=Anopheles farauti TaxID=69004 RepID=A0A182QKA6_9DIPT
MKLSSRALNLNQKRAGKKRAGPKKLKRIRILSVVIFKNFPLRLSMLRFTLLLFVALTAFVAAGPTVRKDEVANAVTSTVETEMKPSVSQEEPQAPPVKLPPVSNDEQATSTVIPTTESTVAPTTTTSRPVTSSSTTTVSQTTPTKSPTTASTGGLTATKPPRKTITFDQRQEGKYNIRADLENFVIVVVPSGSTSGASLLDLLTRSAQKKEAHQTRKASHKRKNNKAHGGLTHHKKAAQVTPEVIVLDETNQRSGQLEAEEFIEGRTPYKVDLSSSARSVDIDEVPMASGRVVRFPGASVHEPLRSDVDMTQLQLQPDDRYDDLGQSDADTDGLDDGWDELRLLGAQEQCGPDRKRDSYGVCQFVQP